MVFYSILLIVYMLALFLNRYATKKMSKKTWTFLLIFPLFLMVALKDSSVGSDTLIYKRIFENSNLLYWSSYFEGYIEAGYKIVNALFKQIGLNFLGFQMIYAAFVYYSLYRLLTKYSNNIAFGVFIFICLRFHFFAMTGMRQMLAISILTYAIPFIIERKLFKFLLIVLVAATIHNTAVFFLLVYLLPIRNLKLKNLVRIMVISIFGIILFDRVLSVFLSVLPKYQSYLVRIDTYEGIFVYIQFIVYAFIMILSLRKRSVYEKGNILEKQTWLNMAVYSFLFALLSIKINIAGRLLKYFSVFIIVYLPNLLESLNNPKEKLIYYYVLVLSFAVYYIVILYYRPSWEGIIPYKLIF